LGHQGGADWYLCEDDAVEFKDRSWLNHVADAMNIRLNKSRHDRRQATQGRSHRSH
jgi:hypothetical protein